MTASGPTCMSKRFHRLMTFAAALFLAAATPAGLIAVAQRASPTPPTTAERTIAEGEARRTLDALVNAIDKRFFDKAKLVRLDFRKLAEDAADDIAAARTPAELAARLNALLARLETSHTSVVTSDEPEYYFIADVFSLSASPDTWAAPNLLPGTGFFTARFDGRDHVTGVLEGSPAHAADIRVGDEIVSVDGAPYHPVRSFRRIVGETAEIAIRRAKDGPTETRNVRVIPIQPSKAFDQAMQASARVIEKNGKRIGYVHVWHMRGDKENLAHALSAIDGSRQSYRPRRNTYARGDSSDNATAVLDALIIDNRGKIGGLADVAESYLSTLAGPRGGYFEALNRVADGRPRPPPPRSFKGRSIMLIDANARSAGEIFAQGYKTENLGPLFGTRTAGAVSAGGVEALPGGLLLYVAVAAVKQDGVTLEGVGVSPTREIARPIPYSAGADPVLDAAIAHLSGAP